MNLIKKSDATWRWLHSKMYLFIYFWPFYLANCMYGIVCLLFLNLLSWAGRITRRQNPAMGSTSQQSASIAKVSCYCFGSVCCQRYREEDTELKRQAYFLVTLFSNTLICSVSRCFDSKKNSKIAEVFLCPLCFFVSLLLLSVFSPHLAHNKSRLSWNKRTVFQM